MAGGPPPRSHGQHEAYVFGEGPTHQAQGWETGTYVCYAASTILLVLGLANKPNTSIKSWAHEEAAARLKLKEAGEDIEYSNFYSKLQKYVYETEEIGDVPTLVGEDEE
eukprot:CAMPEP_0117746004 /NCGR_PEP_ID=MMETSP0947-20121206/7699_1 /TAXON_ID=44440 /ORGANISM="Chattonella subsalsa, Strain CCMP2191" /LENGTH=108 /DNA_ID=CAMNT_0005563267 /DNA_START=125 /DNA_END=451 /DNA_ORIENTATION=-